MILYLVSWYEGVLICAHYCQRHIYTWLHIVRTIDSNSGEIHLNHKGIVLFN